MEKYSSIYSKQHSKIRDIFASAKTLQKVLCVALDYSKAHHEVLFCNGFGHVLKKSFTIPNSPEGLARLKTEIKATCSHRGIQLKHVFIGGEDNPSYVQNFQAHLVKEKFVVVRVNAWEAKTQRENHQASSDKLDVFAIAKALLHKPTYCDQDQAEVYPTLREVSRSRHSFVVQATAVKGHIHGYVERLFPGFLDEKKSGVSPFSAASLALMSRNFSCRMKRSQKDWIKFFQKHGHKNPEEVSQRLQELSKSVLPPCPKMAPIWQESLAQYVAQYQQLGVSIRTFEKELAKTLAKTPGALMTSISGIGVVLAGGFIGELGSSFLERGIRSTCSYIGVVPRVEQTGGPEKPALVRKVQKRCNRRAKHWGVWIGNKIGECGPPELLKEYRRLKDNGQHADFIMTKRILRICKDIMRRGTVYRPKDLLEQQIEPSVMAAYYLKVWDHLREKWQGLIRMEELFDPNYPLGAWRKMVQELYGLSLDFPKQRQSKVR